ncbi:MAG: hypothetical protein M1482_13980 [Chloroflexi bacterium]|nr:hypothetical protein [Chloroflexota bacterium]
MNDLVRVPKFVPFFAGLLALAVFSACAPVAPAGPTPTPTVFYRDPTYAQITPGPHKYVGDLSTTIEVLPFPYSRPLPPPVSTAIDGLYTRTIPTEGTPTPCKRCAGYRLEGGAWSLYFNNGVYKEFQQDTDFEAVGSYAVDGNQLTLFNDPYCEEDVKMQGIYTWEKNGGTLTLTAVNDPCTIGLRAKNLTATSWTKKVDECQPPNREAAVSGHWEQPAECTAKLTPAQ